MVLQQLQKTNSVCFVVSSVVHSSYDAVWTWKCLQKFAGRDGNHHRYFDGRQNLKSHTNIKAAVWHADHFNEVTDGMTAAPVLIYIS
jgi:hypothetical protein